MSERPSHTDSSVLQHHLAVKRVACEIRGRRNQIQSRRFADCAGELFIFPSMTPSGSAQLQTLKLGARTRSVTTCHVGCCHGNSHSGVSLSANCLREEAGGVSPQTGACCPLQAMASTPTSHIPESRAALTSSSSAEESQFKQLSVVLGHVTSDVLESQHLHLRLVLYNKGRLIS